MGLDVSRGRRSYNLGSIEQIPMGEGRTFYVQSRAITIFRGRNGQIFATQPNCPHRGGPLADGVIGDKKVVCPLHGFTFSLETGDPLNNTCQRLRIYPVSVNEAREIVFPLDAIVLMEQESATACYN